MCPLDNTIIMQQQLKNGGSAFRDMSPEPLRDGAETSVVVVEVGRGSLTFDLSVGRTTANALGLSNLYP